MSAGAIATVQDQGDRSGPDKWQVGSHHGAMMRSIGCATDRARRAVHKLDHQAATAYDHCQWFIQAKRVRQQIHDLEDVIAEVGRRMENGDYSPKAPRIRADCEDGPRPCPHLLCRYNLFFDLAHTALGVTKAQLAEASDDVLVEVLFGLRQTCVLDMVDRGPYTLEEIGRMFGLTRERIRQLEFRGHRLLPRGVTRLGLQEKGR